MDIVPHGTEISEDGKTEKILYSIPVQSLDPSYFLRLKIEERKLITAVAFKTPDIEGIGVMVGGSYHSSLADQLVLYDPEQVSFVKVEGPDWLIVAADGTLSGTPVWEDLGLNSFVVQVTDSFGNVDVANLKIMVTATEGWSVVNPEVFPHAIRNPLKGFRPGIWNDPLAAYAHPYAGVAQSYIRWNEIENRESDGIDKIVSFMNQRWREAELRNVKIAPRVYLHWSAENEKYWPSDMTTDDYTSEQFQARLRRLIRRLGQVWDKDPRIAWVQMGIVGKWGEHHSPSPTAAIQQLMGEEFAAAFPNKKVLVRYPWQQFTNFDVGIHWDAFSNWNQMEAFGNIKNLNITRQMWRTNVLEGEAAYNCCGYETQPGLTPTATVKFPIHRYHMIDTIRDIHASALGWTSGYDQNDPEANAGAEEIQRVLGYRYLLNQVRYPTRLTAGEPFDVQFRVTNVGSAPMYSNWPVELSLLDPATKQPVWRGTFVGLDIREWLSGQSYNKATGEYDIPAETIIVDGSFELPTEVATGEYILALAVLDPAGMLPSLRFATVNYFNGGRHPLGRIGVGVEAADPILSPALFSDPRADNSLRYSLETRGIVADAENFSAMNGIQTQATTDQGGGQNIGWINHGDWAEYAINIPTPGNYIVDFRVASGGSGGTIQMVMQESVIGPVTVPNTTGWQNWQTVRTHVTFHHAGPQTLRLNFIGESGFLFNVNWFAYEFF
jgi:hypothetical protein